MNDSKKEYSKVEVAENYDKERFTTKAGKMFDNFEKEVVISHLPNDLNSQILDAGAGSGRFTIEMAKKGFRIISCDYSDAMLNVIESKIEKYNLRDNVTLSKQDITELTFEDNNFDYISCMRVLVNLDNKKNIMKALKEFNRVCKHEGIIVLDIVNSKSLSIFGPKKESYITMNEFKEMINLIPDLEIEEYFGRRILSQMAFEKAPIFLLSLLDVIDKKLSALLPSYCVRIYFVIKKW